MRSIFCPAGLLQICLMLKSVSSFCKTGFTCKYSAGHESDVARNCRVLRPSADVQCLVSYPRTGLLSCSRLLTLSLSGSTGVNDAGNDSLDEVEGTMTDQPPRELSELMQEAGIEFEDLTLMDENVPEGFRAGFVSIIGSPNVGKSTLMNVLVGEAMSIVTSKAQTTRHQIMGVVTRPDFQIAYYDTPGVLQPGYRLQEGMMAFVKQSLSDADVTLFMTDVFEKPNLFADETIFTQLRQCKRPIVVAINKVDLLTKSVNASRRLSQETLDKIGSLESVRQNWQQALPQAEVVLPISAQEGTNVPELLGHIKDRLPLGPPLYPNDTLTDKPQRFFASEIIREKIFTTYSKEIPYSCEVVVTSFKEERRLLRIDATIYTARDAHRPILIGSKGSKLKEVGSLARQELEALFRKKIFLQLIVKVKKNWRTTEQDLRQFGYLQETRR